MEVGLPPIMKAMVLRVNAREIGDMKHFVEEEVGLEFRFDAMINARVDRSLAPLDARLSPEEMVELDPKEENRKNEWAKFCERSKGPAPSPGRGSSLYACGGSRNAFAVDAYGKLNTCVLWHGET